MPTRTDAVDYVRLRQDLVRAVARLCPRWLLSDRDDLVQAATMRVMQAMDRSRFAGEGNPPLSSSYIYKAAYSALVDEIRRVRRRSETGLDDGAAELAATPSADPERAAASSEIGKGVEDCLTRLVQDRRLAVTLYLQGHTVPESARLLGWAAKRTENLVYRGLADLRECLRSKGLQR